MADKVSAILADKGSSVATVAPGATVAEAVALMNERSIGSLLVTEGERLVGIFTERDVLRRVVAARRDPDQTLVRDVMTDDLIVISPTTEVEDAMRIVTDRRCRHLPVVEGRKLVGMISIGDLTRWTIRHQQAEIQDLVSYMTS